MTTHLFFRIRRCHRTVFGLRRVIAVFGLQCLACSVWIPALAYSIWIALTHGPHRPCQHAKQLGSVSCPPDQPKTGSPKIRKKMATKIGKNKYEKYG